MRIQRKFSLAVFFSIFAVSGFSGLIYESIWTHYLKLFLGHAAYAQTLVLAIFMGGMALGSWICSRYSVRWNNLLVGYALTEGVIGLFALFFHTVFDRSVQISYSVVLPHISPAAFANIYKWTLSALLILPQSVLLGMTFPLMSAGILRLSPKNPGRTISLLYFTNSIGAAIGVLVSGFILIRLLGLPWTIRLAGLINIALALIVWFLAGGRQETSLNSKAMEDGLHKQEGGGRYKLFLFASFVTGAASFIYEIGWIRMLSLVMGSSTHAFELMLSAFIFGLAFGGLWIQLRIDRLVIPERYLAHVQVLMGLLALSTLLLYGQTFDVMRWLMNTLGKTDAGYALFNLSSNAIAMAIMLPATFCAGMTLPLITYALIRKGQGERSIGAVYAANTLGAILGVFFAIHVGMPVFGLKGLITFGAGCDIALGVILFWVAAGYESKLRTVLATVAGVCAVGAVVFIVQLDSYKMASGVYRTGDLLSPEITEFNYYKDGKTATISTFLEKDTGVVVINTNGKPDASINMGPGGRPSGDEPTMILAAVLPMAYNPQARTVANIGLGSGLTTHTLLCNPRLKQVDTVEIEKSVVEAARNFLPRVGRVYNDPRSAIFIDDAKTFFSVRNKKYDIIVSEPSNPWVSGVAGLFSEEFYRLIGRHLTEEGLFVQWLQMYEVDNDLVLSVLKAVSNNFSDFVSFAANDRDMLIIAKKKGSLTGLDPDMLKVPEISAELEKIYVGNIQDLEFRKMGNKRFLEKLLKSSPVRANSDYFPVVDQNAARTRFLEANAFDFHNLSHGRLPVFEMLSGSGPLWTATDVTFPTVLFKLQSVYTAMAVRDYSLQGGFGPRYRHVPGNVQKMATQFRQVFYDCRPGTDQSSRHAGIYNASAAMVPYLRPQELDAVWQKMESGPCTRSLPPAERNWIDLFKAVGRRDAGAMASGARTILGGKQQMQQEEIKFLVTSGATGSLMQGDKAGALGLLSAYRSGTFGAAGPDLLFRMLTADSTMPD